jgi:hypothetical protein
VIAANRADARRSTILCMQHSNDMNHLFESTLVWSSDGEAVPRTGYCAAWRGHGG